MLREGGIRVPLLVSWPGRLPRKHFRDPNGFDFLFDIGTDVREQADLSTKRPEALASLKGAWEAIDATLLPYAAG